MKTWIGCVSLALCCAAFGQQTSPKIAFEVVSVKPAEPSPMNQVRMMRSSDPGRVRFQGFALKDLIRVAYEVKDFQVQGPEWLTGTRFDVQGKFPEGATEAQVPQMLQAMLADRFKLTLHRESKEQSVYGLVAGKGGPKLKTAENPTDGAPVMRGMQVTVDDDGAHVKAPSASLANLAELISRFADHPVIDMSGIEGQYDFDLVLSPEVLRAARGGVALGGTEGPSPSDGSKAGSIHEAVQKYGLRLEPRKAPMDLLIVDHVEKTPTEN